MTVEMEDEDATGAINVHIFPPWTLCFVTFATMWLVLGIAELTVICVPCKMAKSKKIVPTFQQILYLTALFEREEINSKTDWAYGIQMFMINLMELQ